MSAHFFSLSSAARTQCLLSDETGILRCIAVWKGQLWETMGPGEKKKPAFTVMVSKQGYLVY